jgi:hypothetical protein
VLSYSLIRRHFFRQAQSTTPRAILLKGTNENSSSRSPFSALDSARASSCFQRQGAEPSSSITMGTSALSTNSSPAQKPDIPHDFRPPAPDCPCTFLHSL